MKRLVSLGLCLGLSIFAMKPSLTLAVVAKGARSTTTEQKADAKTSLGDSNKALPQAEEHEEAADEDTGEEVTSNDDDTMDDASDNEGVVAGEADESDDDEAIDDDSGGDDDGGDDNGNDGGR